MSDLVVMSYEQSLKAHYAAVRRRIATTPVRHAPPRTVRDAMQERRERVARMIQHMREDYAARMRGLWPAWRVIIEEVAAKHNVRSEELTGYSREKRLIPARYEAFYRLHNELGMNPGAIGRRMMRDRTTVIHGLRRHQEMVDG